MMMIAVIEKRGNCDNNVDILFRGFMLMAEVVGERGHGYFVPAPGINSLNSLLSHWWLSLVETSKLAVNRRGLVKNWDCKLYAIVMHVCEELRIRI